jgi:UDP-N-acetylmuramoylalanine--D-glutamate ligase
MAKESFARFFEGKTVTLMGLGLLGRGVGDAAFLARYCKRVFVTDTKSEGELRTSVDALKDCKNIEFFLGGHDFKLFESKDFIVKGAGVRLDDPYIAYAKKNGVPVYMSTALFAHLSSIKTIGVTGTRGKTTTTCMIADILKRAGKKILLGGNLRGLSTLAQIEGADTFDFAVLELDSWQLQGFDDLNISPTIGVFTTFYPDHMNYYDGDRDLYLHDKTAIFRHQKAGDVLITTPEITKLAKQEREKGDNLSKWIIAKPLPSSFKLRIPGAHNLMNAGLAFAASKACGIDEKTIKDALRDFEGVEGRLQFVGAWEGRNFYNDSNATTQEATLAALASFPAASIVLIFGGADKGLPLDRLLARLSGNNVRCVLIKGTGSDRILQKLPDIRVVDTMRDAVKFAVEASKKGDNILLSPAFASFGVFKNEYDRSDQFINEIGKLISDTKGRSCLH